MKRLVMPLACALALAATTVNAAPTLAVVELSQPPVLDAAPLEWGDQSGVRVPLNPIRPDGHSVVEAREVLVKAGRYGDQVVFYLEWRDSEADLLHKPFVWDADKGRYVRGTAREDRLALQFEISGDYSTDWLSGDGFVADMWHWKASRSNPLGLAHDKLTTVSRDKLLRSYRAEGRDGEPRYILRRSDQGSPIYTTARYGRYVKDQMPKYVLAEDPRGSITDIKARGEWRDGVWRLELLRQLDTGRGDDRAFSVGESVRAGIAVFDRSENDDHVISDTLTVEF